MKSFDEKARASLLCRDMNDVETGATTTMMTDPLLVAVTEPHQHRIVSNTTNDNDNNDRLPLIVQNNMKQQQQQQHYDILYQHEDNALGIIGTFDVDRTRIGRSCYSIIVHIIFAIVITIVWIIYFDNLYCILFIIMYVTCTEYTIRKRIYQLRRQHVAMTRNSIYIDYVDIPGSTNIIIRNEIPYHTIQSCTYQSQYHCLTNTMTHTICIVPKSYCYCYNYCCTFHNWYIYGIQNPQKFVNIINAMIQHTTATTTTTTTTNDDNKDMVTSSSSSSSSENIDENIVLPPPLLPPPQPSAPSEQQQQQLDDEESQTNHHHHHHDSKKSDVVIVPIATPIIGSSTITTTSSSYNDTFENFTIE